MGKTQVKLGTWKCNYYTKHGHNTWKSTIKVFLNRGTDFARLANESSGTPKVFIEKEIWIYYENKWKCIWKDPQYLLQKK